MHYQTKLFQVSPHCYCYCVVIFVVVAVVVVVCGGYGNGGVVAQDFADGDVVVFVIVMFLQLFRSF